jgi:hypothetical protein
VHAAETRKIGLARLAFVQGRLVDHQEGACRAVDGLEQIALSVGRKMMD